MAGHGGSSAGSYLADPTSPIPSHCALIVATSTLRVKWHDTPENGIWTERGMGGGWEGEERGINIGSSTTWEGSTMNAKFDLTRVRMHDLQIMTVHFCHWDACSNHSAISDLSQTWGTTRTQQTLKRKEKKYVITLLSTSVGSLLLYYYIYRKYNI